MKARKAVSLALASSLLFGGVDAAHAAPADNERGFTSWEKKDWSVDDVKLVTRGATCYVYGPSMYDAFETLYGRTFKAENWTAAEAEAFLPLLEANRAETDRDGLWSNELQRYRPVSEVLTPTEIAIAEAQFNALKQCAAYRDPVSTSQQSGSSSPASTAALVISLLSLITALAGLAAPFVQNLV